MNRKIRPILVILVPVSALTLLTPQKSEAQQVREHGNSSTVTEEKSSLPPMTDEEFLEQFDLIIQDCIKEAQEEQKKTDAEELTRTAKKRDFWRRGCILEGCITAGILFGVWAVKTN